MYNSIHFNKETKVLSILDDEKGLIQKKYKPYYWKPCNQSIYKTIYGQTVEKVHSFSKDHYENDIHPILRTLVDLYYATDDNAKNNIIFFDIETSAVGGFPNIETGDKEIYSICCSLNNEYHIFLYYDGSEKIDVNGINLRIYDDERKMLLGFMEWLNEVNCTVMTSWNGDRFDLPYLLNRMETLNVDSSILSPIGIIETKENGFVSIGCRNHLDYMELYKKFCINDRQSYSLDYICEYELGEKKLEHDGIDKMYQYDINKFIRYNVRDVKLITKLEEKLNYLDIAITLSHEAHVPYEWVFSQSRIIEGSIFTYFKRNKIVAPNRPEQKETTQIDGAYVKDPKPGLYRNIIDLDYTSLYPNIIRTLNLSPETKIGKVSNWKKYIKSFYDYNRGCEIDDFRVDFYYEDKKKTFSVSFFDFCKKLKTNNWSISCLGVVSRTDKIGFISDIITMWFDDRVKFRKLKEKSTDKKNYEDEKRYDIKQYTKKIEMNSFYGALAMPSFRFYDRDIAESVTVTGQYLTKSAEKIINKKLNSERVFYCDTDSTYITLEGLVITTDEIKEIAKELQDHVNDKIGDTVKYLLNVSENKYLSLKQEIISETGIWLAKKKYVQKIIDQEGYIPKDPIGIKGIDIIKSSFPICMKNFLKEIVIDMLDEKPTDYIDEKLYEFNMNKDDIPIEEIGINTGVKNLSKYYDSKIGHIKGTPVHCKAALNYNMMLKKKKLEKKYKSIDSGDKIKYYYLKNNPENISEIALNNNDHCKEVSKFIEQYIDRDKIFKSVLENKVASFYKALNWKFPDFTQNVNRDYF